MIKNDVNASGAKQSKMRCRVRVGFAAYQSYLLFFICLTGQNLSSCHQSFTLSSFDFVVLSFSRKAFHVNCSYIPSLLYLNKSSTF